MSSGWGRDNPTTTAAARAPPPLDPETQPSLRCAASRRAAPPLPHHLPHGQTPPRPVRPAARARGLPADVSGSGRPRRAHPRFFRQLEQMGAELALHGYDHVDFRSLSPAEATTQLVRAAGVVLGRGRRLPGLSLPVPELHRGARGRGARGPRPLQQQQSDLVEDAVRARSPRVCRVTTLRNFYRPKSAEDVVSVPRLEGERVEIPVPLPDDLQLVDGLVLGRAGRERAAPVGPPMPPRSRRARLTRQRTKPAVGGQRTTGYRDPTDPTLLPRVRTSLTI